MPLPVAAVTSHLLCSELGHYFGWMVLSLTIIAVFTPREMQQQRSVYTNFTKHGDSIDPFLQKVRSPRVLPSKTMVTLINAEAAEAKGRKNVIS